MIGANVGYNSDVAGLKCKPAAEYATSRTFKHREVNSGIFKHKLCAHRPGAIATHHQRVLNVYTVRSCEANFIARTLADVSSKPCGGSLTISARHRNDRDAACRSFRKQH